MDSEWILKYSLHLFTSTIYSPPIITSTLLCARLCQFILRFSQILLIFNWNFVDFYPSQFEFFPLQYGFCWWWKTALSLQLRFLHLEIWSANLAGAPPWPTLRRSKLSYSISERNLVVSYIFHWVATQDTPTSHLLTVRHNNVLQSKINQIYGHSCTPVTPTWGRHARPFFGPR